MDFRNLNVEYPDTITSRIDKSRDTIVRIDDDLIDVESIRRMEHDVTNELEIVYSSVNEVNELNSKLVNLELSKEEFIISLSKLGYERTEIKLAVEDWENTKEKMKTGVLNILQDTLSAIMRVSHKAFINMINLANTMVATISDRTTSILELKYMLSNLDKNTNIIVDKKTVDYIKKKFPLFLNENNVLDMNKILNYVSHNTAQIDVLFKNFNKVVKNYKDGITKEDIIEELEDLNDGFSDNFSKDLLNYFNSDKYINLALLSVENKTIKLLVLKNNKKTPTLDIVSVNTKAYVDNVDLRNFKTINDLIKNIDLLVHHSGKFKVFTKTIKSYNNIYKNNADLICKNIKHSVNENYEKDEQHKELTNARILSHSLEILSKKLISTVTSNYFWNLRACMRTVEFMSYNYVKNKKEDLG